MISDGGVCLEMYTLPIHDGADMLLSCPAKKVTKERGIGEALRLGAPARRAALPYVPHPARTIYPLEHLNGQKLLSG